MSELCNISLGDDGLKVRVWNHADAPDEFTVDISRHGAKECTCRNATELTQLGEQIRLAGLRAQTLR